MNFHIQTPDGVVRAIDFPLDQPVGVMLRELVTDEDFGIKPPKPEAWHLLHEESEHKLDPGKNLEQNGVKKGERLRLTRAHEESAKSAGPVPGEMTRCDNGHYYDRKKHTAGCPYCGAAIAMPVGRSIRIGPVVEGDQKTRPQGMPRPSAGVTEEGATKVFSPGGPHPIDPVVGWLVNVKGESQGADYRIRSENNTIGRSKDMYISIPDESISRERHAVITFDPLQNAFHLSPGEGRGLVYVNGEVLLAHRRLQAYDRIQMGQTKLVFVPFCGEKFTWGKDDE